MRTTLFLGALIAAATTNAAHADQCAKNPTAVADKAAALVTKGATVLELCEPCRDAAPGKPFTVQSVSTSDGELAINGKPVDLAYVFLKTGPDEFTNVGKLAGCGASGVSEKITGGKPSGRIKTPPAPPPRPASADELAGTWEVRLTTRYSSCTAMAPAGVADWTIAITKGALTLEGSDGAQLVGTFDKKLVGPQVFRATFHPKIRPSSAALQVTMFTKDRLHGSFLRTDKVSNPSDPVCVIQQDIQAKRRP